MKKNQTLSAQGTETTKKIKETVDAIKALEKDSQSKSLQFYPQMFFKIKEHKDSIARLQKQLKRDDVASLISKELFSKRKTELEEVSKILSDRFRAEVVLIEDLESKNLFETFRDSLAQLPFSKQQSSSVEPKKKRAINFHQTAKHNSVYQQVKMLSAETCPPTLEQYLIESRQYFFYQYMADVRDIFSLDVDADNIKKFFTSDAYTLVYAFFEDKHLQDLQKVLFLKQYWNFLKKTFVGTSEHHPLFYLFKSDQQDVIFLEEENHFGHDEGSDLCILLADWRKQENMQNLLDEHFGHLQPLYEAFYQHIEGCLIHEMQLQIEAIDILPSLSDEGKIVQDFKETFELFHNQVVRPFGSMPSRFAIETRLDRTKKIETILSNILELLSGIDSEHYKDVLSTTTTSKKLLLQSIKYQTMTPKELRAQSPLCVLELDLSERKNSLFQVAFDQWQSYFITVQLIASNYAPEKPGIQKISTEAQALKKDFALLEQSLDQMMCFDSKLSASTHLQLAYPKLLTTLDRHLSTPFSLNQLRELLMKSAAFEKIVNHFNHQDYPSLWTKEKAVKFLKILQIKSLLLGDNGTIKEFYNDLYRKFYEQVSDLILEEDEAISFDIDLLLSVVFQPLTSDEFLSEEVLGWVPFTQAETWQAIENYYLLTLSNHLDKIFEHKLLKQDTERFSLHQSALRLKSFPVHFQTGLLHKKIELYQDRLEKKLMDHAKQHIKDYPILLSWYHLMSACNMTASADYQSAIVEGFVPYLNHLIVASSGLKIEELMTISYESQDRQYKKKNLLHPALALIFSQPAPQVIDSLLVQKSALFELMKMTYQKQLVHLQEGTEAALAHLKTLLISKWKEGVESSDIQESTLVIEDRSSQESVQEDAQQSLEASTIFVPDQKLEPVDDGEFNVILEEVLDSSSEKDNLITAVAQAEQDPRALLRHLNAFKKFLEAQPHSTGSWERVLPDHFEVTLDQEKDFSVIFELAQKVSSHKKKLN